MKRSQRRRHWSRGSSIATKRAATCAVTAEVSNRADQPVSSCNLVKSQTSRWRRSTKWYMTKLVQTVQSTSERNRWWQRWEHVTACYGSLSNSLVLESRECSWMIWCTNSDRQWRVVRGWSWSQSRLSLVCLHWVAASGVRNNFRVVTLCVRFFAGDVRCRRRCSGQGAECYQRRDDTLNTDF